MHAQRKHAGEKAMREGLAFFTPRPPDKENRDEQAFLVGGRVADQGDGQLQITPMLWVFLRKDPPRAEIMAAAHEESLTRLRKIARDRTRPPMTPVIQWIASLMREVGFDDLGTVPEELH